MTDWSKFTDSDESARARMSVQFGMQANPDQAGEAARLARRYGLPQDLVEFYKDDYKAQAKVEDVDRVMATSPRLQAWIAADDARAKVTHDDLENMSLIEKSIGMIGQGVRAVASGAPRLSAGLYGVAAAPFELIGLDSVGGWLRGQQKNAENVAEGWMGMSKDAGFMERSIMSGLQSAGQTLVTLPVGLANAGRVTGENLMLAIMGAGQGGESYGKARDQGLTPAQSIVYGTQDAVAEVVGEKYLGAAGLLRNIKAGASAGKLFAYELAKEVPGEVGTTLWQNFNEWGNLNPEKSVADWLSEQPEAIAQTVIATLVGGGTQIGAIKGVEKAANYIASKADQAKQADAAANLIGQLNALAAASKVASRDADTLQDFVAHATEDSPAQNLYINAQTLAQSGIVEQLAQVSPAVAEQLQTALATGGEVRIPIAEYAAKIAPTEYAQQLVDHLRVEGEQFTRAEAQAYMQSDAAQELQAHVERTLAEKQGDDAFKQSAEAVKTNIKQQLDTASRFTGEVNEAYASMVGNFYAVMAAKLNTTPEELYAKYPLRVAAEALQNSEGNAGESYGQGGLWHGSKDPSWIDRGEAFDATRPANAPSKYLFLTTNLNVAETYAGISEMQRWKAENGMGSAAPETAGVREFGMQKGAKVLKVTDVKKAAAKLGVEWAGENPLETLLDAAKAAGYDAVKMSVDGDNIAVLNPAKFSAVRQLAQFPIAYTADTIEVDGKQRPTTNSNGQRIAQTEEGLRNFWRWFGDSKVVDAEGKPLVVYHATQSDIPIDVFNRRYKADVKRQPDSIDSIGTWFTDSIVRVNDYADGSVYPAYLKIENPREYQSFNDLRFDWKDAQLSGKRDAAWKKRKAQFERNNHFGDSDEFVAELGYDDQDGVIINRNGDGEWKDQTAYLAIEPTQIKSAIGNRGTFDPANANILMQSGQERYKGVPTSEWSPDQALIDAAKKYFGTTLRPLEAGYVLPDGTMLDFSGRHETSKDNWPYMRDQRSIDHRMLLSENMAGFSMSDMFESSDGNEAMHEFMARTGAMRVDFTSSIASTMRPPSAAQLNVVARNIGRDYAAVSYVDGGSGRIIADAEWDNVTGAKVKNFFAENKDKKPDARAPLFQGGNTNRGSYNPATNTITLLKNADLSTFLHESGHAFLEMQFDIAAKLSAIDELTEGERQVVADSEALLKWFGVQSMGEWYSLDFEEKRAYHEKFARGFEAYLFEGKAPSIELQGMFQRFRAWLLNVYRELKNLNVELTDEVRGVFDRMLATNDEIKMAEQGRSMIPLFETAEQAGMTQEEFAAYHALGVDATNDAIQDLQARGLRDMAYLRNARGREIKRLKKEAAARRAEVQMDVRREVMSQPLYRAWQFLTGKMGKDDKVETPTPAKSSPDVLDSTIDSLFVAIAKLGGLNREEVVGSWGTDPADKPTSGVFGKPVWRKEGGRSLDGMREVLGEHGWRFETLQDFEEAFNAELRGDPVYSDNYAPQDFTGRPGDQVVNLEGLAAGRLDLVSLREIGLPEQIIDHLKALKMTAKDGLHPDVVAEMFGYTSGDELVRRLAAADKPKDAIEGLTDARMLEQYGELATPEAIEREADKAIHNEARARMVATEANALAKAAGQRKVLASAAKEFARAMISRLKVRDIRPSQYANAEVRAAKAAEKASKAGDIAQAATEKRNQLINTYATRAAYDARDEVESARRYLKKFDGDIKGLDAEYAEQIASLLERFDLRQRSLKSIDKSASLAKWMESMRDQGLEPDVPEDLQNEAFRKSYKDMTVEELRGLVDTVKQIEHLGRLKNRLLTAANNRAFDAVKAEIVQSINENGNGREADTRTPTTNLGRAAQSVKTFFAAHVKAATWARILDGGKDGGPMWEYFVRSANERGDMETTMRAEATTKLSQILAPIFKLGKMGGKGQYFDSIKRSLNREARLAIALNTGNQGNLQRLLGGEGWTLPQIMPVLQSLTAQEWQAVQAVWDHFESYRPQIAAKERRVYGKEPDWVQPSPFTIKTADGQDVEVRGGYYPIKYDPAASQRAESHADAEDAKRQMQGAYTSATTRRSFTKSRVEEINGRPLLYTMAGLYSGVNDVIHDLAWHEWLIDANRLLRSQSIDSAIRNTYGPQVKAQFKTWVRDVAAGEQASDNAAEMALGKLRQNISASGLGFNIVSAVLQGLGLTQSIVRVGLKPIASGVMKYVGSPLDTSNMVREKSEFMRNRARTRWRELNELRNKVQGESDARSFLKEGTYYLLMQCQTMVDVPTWIGAYEKAITAGNDESRAVALADQSVIDAQGGGQTKDLAAIERGGSALKLFTVFYSFMNTAYNLGVDQTMTQKSKAKLAANYLMLYTVPAALGAVLKDAFTPGGDDDDMEKLARKLAAEQLSYLMGLMVVVREFSFAAKTVVGAEGGARDYQGPAGVRMVADFGSFVKQAAQMEFDDSFRKAAVNLIGDMTGLPSAQVNRTITGAKALYEGETDNPAAIAFGFQRKW